MEKSQNSSRSAKIQSKKNQLQKVSEEIRALDSQAKKKNLELKKQKESNTANRLSKTRIVMHHNATVSDRVLRPPDRGNDIRTYGKMDLDVWQYEQVRDWFNEYGQPVPHPHETPAETGYMIAK
mmetsp:Transcript_26489/g.44779  ORF Transcript_26489/g.44779 Transcript_26489/m.44779 type:complete len:124 (+) Transcript_26489:132-503(+)